MPTSPSWFDPPHRYNLAHTEAADRERQHSYYQSSYNEDTAQRLVEFSGAYPLLAPGVVAAAAVSDVPITEPGLAELEISQVERNAEAIRALGEGRNPVEWLYDTLRGVVRVGTLALDVGYQELIERPLRAIVGMTQGYDLGEAWDLSGESVGVRAFGQLMNNEPVNLGTGWFVHADSSTLAPKTAARLNAGMSLDKAIRNPQQVALGAPLTQQFEEERSQIQITHDESGKTSPVSLGTLLSIQVAEPGTVPFQVASGILDLAAMVKLDPAGAVLKTIGKTRAAARILVADGVRPTRLAQNWSTWLNSDETFDVLETIAREKNYDRLFRLLRQANPNFPHGYVRSLTEADTVNEVKAVLEAAHDAKALTRTITPVSVTGRLLGVNSLRTAAAGGLARIGAGRDAERAAQAAAARAGEIASQRALSGGVGPVLAEMGGPVLPISQARQRLRLAQAGGVKLGMGDITRGTYWGRMMADIGTQMVDFGNPEMAMNTWSNFLSSVGFDSATQGEYMHRMSTSLEGGIDSVFATANDAVAQWGKNMAARGVEAPVIEKFQNVFNQQNEIRSYARNALGRAAWHPGVKEQVMLNGERVPVPTAFELSQMLDRSIMLPDARMVRRVFNRSNLNRFRNATGIPLGRKLTDANKITTQSMVGYMLDNAMTKFWKPFALLRGAWLVRVIAEEQVRMAGAGLDSMIFHPFHAASMIAGRKVTEDIKGDAFTELGDWKAAQTRQNDFRIVREGRLAYRQTGHWLSRSKGQDGHTLGWWNRLYQMMEDPVASRLLATDSLDDVKKAFWDGDLAPSRKKLMWDGENWDELATPEGSDAYIEWLHGHNETMLGGDYIYWRKDTNRWYDSADRVLPVSDPNIPVQPMPVPRDISRPSGPETGIIGRGRVLSAPSGWEDGTTRLPIGELLEPSDLDPAAINTHLVETGVSIRRIQEGLLGKVDADYTEVNLENINFEVKEIVSRLYRNKIITKNEARTHYRRLARAKERLASTDPTVVRQGKADLDKVLTDSSHATAQRYAAGVGRPMVPGENALEAVWDIRGGNIHGTLTLGRDVDGVPRTIHSLTQTGHAEGTVARLFDESLPEMTGTELLGLKTWGDDGQLITLREWLEIRAPNLPPIDVANRHQVIDLVDRVISAMRYPTGRIGRASAAARQAADDAPDFAASARYHIIRGGNAELRQGLVEKNLRGIDLQKVGRNIDPEAVETRSVTAMLRRDFDDAAPQWTDVPETEATGRTERWGNFLDFLMSSTMGKGTNIASRSPAFRQIYYNFAGTELLGYMTPAQRAQFIRQALGVGVRRATVKGWLKQLGVGAGDIKAIQAGDITKLGPMPQAPFSSLEEAAEIASAHALTETRNLLYDVVKRKNIFDALRIVFPFGDAWAEVLTSWAKLAYKNPQIIRRVDQTLRYARQRGFFYTDPNTGDEVFNYPAQGILSWLAVGDSKGEGTQLRFTGRSSGLNLAMSGFLPGFGPAIQMPLAHFAPLADPDHSWAQELLFPFGTPELESPGQWFDQLTPPWFRRLLAGLGAKTGETAELYGRTEMDMMRMLLMTGKYDTTSSASREKLFKDAEGKTGQMFLVRAIAAFFGPTPPTVRYEAEDRNGTLWTYTNLGSEFAKMVEKWDGDETRAFDEFAQRFGLDPSLYSTHKTRSLVRRSVTPSGVEFQQRNPQVFDQHPLTAYFLYPDDPLDEEFEMDGYMAQLREGTRVQLTTPQWLTERNDFLGRLAYEHARQVAGGRNDYTAINWLRSTRSELRVLYPGYDQENLGLPQKAPRDEVIAELEKWPKNPAIMKTAVGAAVAHYLRAREWAKARAIEAGLSPMGFLSADRLLYVRDWLRVQGAGLVRKYPEFSAVWIEVFQREIEEPDLAADEYLAQVQAATP